MKLNEIILLRSPALKHSLTLNENVQYNAALCSFSMADGSRVYICIVPETPDECWRRIMESYGIKCEIVIDSLKGMGNWFEDIPLYSAMSDTKAPWLRPRFYFKGLYISHDAPKGFRLIYTIPETINAFRQEVKGWEKEIYETGWNTVPSSSPVIS